MRATEAFAESWDLVGLVQFESKTRRVQFVCRRIRTSQSLTISKQIKFLGPSVLQEIKICSLLLIFTVVCVRVDVNQFKFARLCVRVSA